MAKAVTLKNTNGDELYPTTTAELVNGLDTEIDDALADLYYKPGDVVYCSETNSSGGPSLSGYLTGSNKDLRFFIPLQKRLDNISSATLTTMRCLCRLANGGYATGLNLTTQDLLAAASSIQYYVVKEMNGIYVRATATTNWGATNNIPVSFEVLEMRLVLS